MKIYTQRIKCKRYQVCTYYTAGKR